MIKVEKERERDKVGRHAREFVLEEKLFTSQTHSRNGIKMEIIQIVNIFSAFFSRKPRFMF